MDNKITDPVALLQKRKTFICEKAGKLKDINIFRAIQKCIGDGGYNALVTDCSGGSSVNLDLLPEELINKIYSIVSQKLTDQALPDNYGI